MSSVTSQFPQPESYLNHGVIMILGVFDFPAEFRYKESIACP